MFVYLQEINHKIGGIVMDQPKLTEEQKQSFIDYMLRNEEVEKAIQKTDKALPLYEISVLRSILLRCEDNAGFIVAVDSCEIPTGVDNLGFYTEITMYSKMHCAAKEDGEKYVMVFTSKSRFMEIDGLSGVVIPIDILIGMICLKKAETDGIVINLKKEELIIKMPALEFLYNCICELESEPK